MIIKHKYPFQLTKEEKELVHLALDWFEFRLIERMVAGTAGNETPKLRDRISQLKAKFDE